jgi:hypothetical protein
MPEDTHVVRDFRIKYGTVSTFITIKLKILILEDDSEVFIVNISNKRMVTPRKFWGVSHDFHLLELRGILYTKFTKLQNEGRGYL